MTREEMFLNAMINGDEVPEPTTREEMLLKQLAEKLNKPVYTYLYVLTDNWVYLDKEGENKCTRSYVENLFRTNPIYMTYYEENDGEISINEGILINLYSRYGYGDYIFDYKDKQFIHYLIDDINN